MKLSEFVEELVKIKNDNPNIDPEVYVDSSYKIEEAKIAKFTNANAKSSLIGIIICCDN